MGGDCTQGSGSGVPDPELARVYQSAVYEVELLTGKVAFRVGDGVPGAPGPFAVVTAYNPGRERPPAEVNEARNRELLAEIERRGFRWLPAEGRSGDGAHREPSFAVFGLELEDALQLARAFGQAAVCWFDGRVVRLAWC